jgi:type II secretory pathway component PulF
MEVLYGLPVVSTLIQEIDVTRFSRSLHLLLTSGLPITTALELTSNVVIKRKTAEIIRRSRDMVLAGKKLSEGFRAGKGYIPTLMIKLMEAGEKTGTLDKSMQDISEFYDYEVTNTLKTLTALLEPILLVAVGIVVGGMMLAIIAPVYGLIGQVGAH